jgi:NAD(P) transhydrogenase subunit alpha
MRIGVPLERHPGETRVSIVPESVARLVARGLEVVVEAGAGDRAGVRDADYVRAGAVVVPSEEALGDAADVRLGVEPPGPDVVARLRAGQAVIAPLDPARRPDLLAAIAARGARAVAIDAVPRTTLAQSMDVRSSQATVVGYRAVVVAAAALPRMFPLMTTAAGTVAPARVLVLGAGVAGLSAIATARRLGAVVEAFDARHAAREHVESLGARFVEVPGEDAEGAGGYAREVSPEYRRAQAALLADRIAKADVCVTTALVPGRPAPVLVTAEMVAAMRAGSVIVDVAASEGGNCALTRPGDRVVTEGGVIVVGASNLAAEVPVHASQLWSRNVERLLLHLVGPEGHELHLDAGDAITRAVVVDRPRGGDP